LTLHHSSRSSSSSSSSSSERHTSQQLSQRASTLNSSARGTAAGDDVQPDIGEDEEVSSSCGCISPYQQQPLTHVTHTLLRCHHGAN
jgi:hypothetical protein